MCGCDITKPSDFNSKECGLGGESVREAQQGAGGRSEGSVHSGFPSSSTFSLVCPPHVMFTHKSARFSTVHDSRRRLASQEASSEEPLSGICINPLHLFTPNPVKGFYPDQHQSLTYIFNVQFQGCWQRIPAEINSFY